MTKQSIKGKMCHTSGGEGPSPNKKEFLARSGNSAESRSRSSPGDPTPGSTTTTPMAPAGSFRNPSRFGSAQIARTQPQTFDEQPLNPYVQHVPASPPATASPGSTTTRTTPMASTGSFGKLLRFGIAQNTRSQQLIFDEQPPSSYVPNVQASPSPSPSASPASTPTPMAPPGRLKNNPRFEFARSAQTQQQTFDEQPPNPYVHHVQASPSPSPSRSAPPSDAKVDSTDHSNSRSTPAMSPPNVYEGSQPWQRQQQQFTGKGEGGGPPESPEVAELVDEELLTGQQVLVAIPGAMIHLVNHDDEESTSVHLASGEFSLVRITQEKVEESLVIAKVGEQLKWPLVKDASSPTVKLDSTHYFFTLQVPRMLAAPDHRVDEDTAKQKHQMETVTYGLTLPAAVGLSGSNDGDEQAAARTRTCALDYFLQRYSKFSAPTIVKENAAYAEVHHQEAEVDRAIALIDNDGNNLAVQVIPPETTVSGDDGMKVKEERGAAFWTTVAPNVDDYNSKVAKCIAKGVGYVIEDIFILSDSTMTKMDSGHDYMTSKTKPKRQPSNFSPSAINGARSARRLTAKTDKVVGGIVGGVLYATNSMLSAAVNSHHGKKIFNTTPGEVALVSLEAVVSISDAIEEAGKDILSRASSVTQEFVNDRYGDSARQLTDESFRSVGHAMSVAWSINKILDIDPKIHRKLGGKENRTIDPARPDQLTQVAQTEKALQPALDPNPYVQLS